MTCIEAAGLRGCGAAGLRGCGAAALRRCGAAGLRAAVWVGLGTQMQRQQCSNAALQSIQQCTVTAQKG